MKELTKVRECINKLKDVRAGFNAATIVIETGTIPQCVRQALHDSGNDLTLVIEDMEDALMTALHKERIETNGPVENEGVSTFFGF